MNIIKKIYRKYNIWKSGVKRDRNLTIMPPFRIEGGKNIYIKNNTYINRYSWIATYNLTGFKAQIVIGENVRISYYCHIISTYSVVIGNNVNIANSVYISDNIHGYENISIPIKDQPIIQKNKVIIGNDTWIGEHACIIGAKIGKHCVIGANSVVTKNIPDYSVVAGVPAKIIKRYDVKSKGWRRTDEFGSFIEEKV